MLSFSSVGNYFLLCKCYHFRCYLLIVENVIIFHDVNVMITINDNINDIINDNALKMIT
jgi:hypothetical protein